MALVSYTLDDGIATVMMDDGKANALSNEMQGELHAALDHAESDSATAVVLTGRVGRFSGGFDLATLGAGGDDAVRMVRGGFELADRILVNPAPVVVACNGHALAMGAFLLCSGDHRIGARGEFRIQANEVAIGLPLPLPAQAILRHRLTPSAFDRAAVLAAPFSPEEAVTAGFLHEVADPDDVLTVAIERARAAAALDPSAYRSTKKRVRATFLSELRSGIDADFGEAGADLG